jgi:cytochrome c-type biogenesis protein CcmH
MMLAGNVLATEERTFTRSEMERYNKVTHALVAPCCWREAIAIHRSAEAQQMLDEVKQFVADGRSENEIKALYVARYGVRILADPPGSAGQWLYITPFALLCCLFLVASLRLRSLVACGAPPVPQAPPELIARVRMETENEWN